MASRLLLRLGTFRQVPPSPALPRLAGAGGLHHSSPLDVRHHLHVMLPPRVAANGRRWFGGGSHTHSWSSPKSKPLGRLIVGNVISAASFSAAGLLTANKKSDKESPPMGPNNHGSNKDKRHCTDALIAINFLVHLVDVATKRKLCMLGAKNNDLIKKGEIWRLATAAVLHKDFIHFANNNRALEELGPMVEEVTGTKRFLAIYCTSALSGSLMSYWFNPARSIGASGAICGLIGAKAVYMWRHREFVEKANETLVDIALVVLINLAIGLFLKHDIDNCGHLGGLLGGAAVEWFVGPHWKKHVGPYGREAFQDRAPLVSLTDS
ncbi:hypothetical protein VPH35_033250 [Triticum aestivum]